MIDIRISKAHEQQRPSPPSLPPSLWPYLGGMQVHGLDAVGPRRQLFLDLETERLCGGECVGVRVGEWHHTHFNTRIIMRGSAQAPTRHTPSPKHLPSFQAGKHRPRSSSWCLCGCVCVAWCGL